jgi:ribosomal protein S18 acetylase RimI-like enzyme
VTDTGFTVREARTPAEVEAAGRVTVAANAEFLPEDGELQALWAEYVKSQADAASRAAAGTLLVAVDDASGEVVGTVTLYLAQTDHSNQWRPDDPIFRFLAVDPAARQRGIGRALVSECLRRARAVGKRRMALHTTVSQAVAVGMYERAGFVREPEGDFTLDPVTIIAYAREL